MYSFVAGHTISSQAQHQGAACAGQKLIVTEAMQHRDMLHGQERWAREE